MNKEDIEKWCRENNYLLVDLKKKQVSPEIVIRISEEATNIEDIGVKTRKGQYSFARNIAVNYLYKKLPNGVLAKRLNVGHDMVNYYMNHDVLETDPKYLKEWQREAVSFFREKVCEIESSL